MNDKRRALLIMVGILFACILAISYAFYQLSFTQEGDGIGGETRCFEIDFVGGNAIHIPRAMPMTDANGEASDPYTFTITNTCDMRVGYQVNLEVLDTTTMELEFIKYKFGVGTTGAPTILETATTTTSTITNSTAKLMGTGELNRDASVTYNLRMWMVEEATYSDVEGRRISARVSVVSTAIR